MIKRKIFKEDFWIKSSIEREIEDKNQSDQKKDLQGKKYNFTEEITNDKFNIIKEDFQGKYSNIKSFEKEIEDKTNVIKGRSEEYSINKMT